MSVIEKLEQTLDRVIRSATEHARFSAKLDEDVAAIESKVAGLQGNRVKKEVTRG